MADTLGSIIDKLCTADLKMWNNQEILYKIRRMTFDEFKEETPPTITSFVKENMKRMGFDTHRRRYARTTLSRLAKSEFNYISPSPGKVCINTFSRIIDFALRNGASVARIINIFNSPYFCSISIFCWCPIRHIANCFQ